MTRKLALANEELVRQYQAGKSTIKLARRCRCHPSTIRNRLLKLGVTLRPVINKLKDLTRDELERLIQVEGLSDGQIGDRYGVSSSTIRIRRLRYGIASHPRNAKRVPQTRFGRPLRRQQEANHG